jgi:hypothetical protein
MAYKLSKGKNSTKYDNQISQIVGQYDTILDAYFALSFMEFQISETPDGSIWIYPWDMNDEDIMADVAGYDLLAKIEECQ